MNTSNPEVITYKGGDGSCISEAVEIIGANCFRSGMEAIFDYIEQVAAFKEIVTMEGEVINYWDKTFHCVDIATKKGRYGRIFFNATDFQNKIRAEDAEIVKQIFDNYS